MTRPSPPTQHPDNTAKKSASTDQRLLVVAVCGCMLLFFTPLRHIGDISQNESMQLKIDRGALQLVPAYTDAGRQPQTPSCNPLQPAQLSQFFFQPVPVNRAEKPLLMTLPAVGETMAERIIATRQAGGPFSDLEDMARVPGFGPKRLANLHEKVCFDEQ